MVNKTESGAIAVGAPMSDARIKEEALNVLKNGTSLLSKTDEGLELLRKFNTSHYYFDSIDIFLNRFLK